MIICAYLILSIFKLKSFEVFNFAVYFGIKSHIILENLALLLTLLLFLILVLYDIILII